MRCSISDAGNSATITQPYVSATYVQPPAATPDARKYRHESIDTSHRSRKAVRPQSAAHSNAWRANASRTVQLYSVNNESNAPHWTARSHAVSRLHDSNSRKTGSRFTEGQTLCEYCGVVIIIFFFHYYYFVIGILKEAL